jgi:hypothetical protein
MTASRVSALLTLALLTACGGPRPLPPAPPVPLDGSRSDVRALEGTWVGEFIDSRGSRRGVISLTLEAGRDTAHGRLLMEGAPPPKAGCTDAVSSAVQAPGERGPTVLRLGRIVIAEGTVAGWVESYQDLELGCPVDTWFEGRVRRDTLRGMFFAHPQVGDTVRRGTWWAARQPSR